MIERVHDRALLRENYAVMVRQIFLHGDCRIEVANAVFCGFDDPFHRTRLKDIRLGACDHVFAELVYGAFRFQLGETGVKHFQEVWLFNLKDLAYSTKISGMGPLAADEGGEKAGRDREERAVCTKTRHQPFFSNLRQCSR